MAKKYIDAGKLIAEIDSRMEDCKLPDGKFPTTTNIVRYEELSCLRNFITSLQQEQPEVALIYKPNMTISEMVDSINGKQPEVDLEKAARYVYESWMGGTMDDVRRDMVELGKVLNARKEKQMWTTNSSKK